jgi:sulfate adenylyltransferase
MSLDANGVALLDQVLLGLADDALLPRAETYLDEEGTPVAVRREGLLASVGSRPWLRPSDVRSQRPVVVAVADRVPAGPISPPDAVVLLPSGGVRADDARWAAWSAAWAQAASAVVPVPVPPGEAGSRAKELAAAYSSGELLDVPTVPAARGTGRVVFFTGLSGSGKSTIARAVVARLAAERTVTLLDGDVVRTHLSKGLGFSREDRDTNIRRIGWVAAEVAKHGGIAVCAPIAPYDDTRQWVRRLVEQAAGPDTFLLVWIATPVEVCEQRDVKGLYAKARAGELRGFTGVNDPYEAPSGADVVIDTSRIAVDQAVERVLAAVRR